MGETLSVLVDVRVDVVPCVSACASPFLVVVIRVSANVRLPRDVHIFVYLHVCVILYVPCQRGPICQRPMFRGEFRVGSVLVVRVTGSGGVVPNERWGEVSPDRFRAINEDIMKVRVRCLEERVKGVVVRACEICTVGFVDS